MKAMKTQLKKKNETDIRMGNDFPGKENAGGKT